MVNGFCGMRMGENHLEFSPHLPARYRSVRFRVVYRKNRYEILCEKKKVNIHLVRGENPSLKIKVNRIEAQKI